MGKMPDVGWIIIAFLIVILGFIVPHRYMEGFESTGTSTNDADVVQHITKIYLDILERYPNNNEVKEHQRPIIKGTRTFDGVRQRLIDSAEYKNKIKLQSNTLSPELPKMISDSKLLRHLASIYQEVRGKRIPPKMVLPIKDVYVRLDYNDDALRYMLRSESWTDFEQDILDDEDFSEQKLDELIHKHFGSIAKIMENAAASVPKPSNVEQKIKRMIEDEDSDMSNLLKRIKDEAKYIENKVLPANKNTECVRDQEISIRTHEGDMVLRPEFAWSVPQHRPPVCTTLGQPSPVQPVHLNSSLAANATPLSEAANTSVGSIMPKFRYKEYVDVPIKGKCSSLKPIS